MPQRTALALGVVYVLLQAVHYTVWLALIPKDDARAEGTLSFSMSAALPRARLPHPVARRDRRCSPPVLGASFLDVHRTRQLYLSLATFHGYLELAAGTFLVVRGK